MKKFLHLLFCVFLLNINFTCSTNFVNLTDEENEQFLTNSKKIAQQIYSQLPDDVKKKFHEQFNLLGTNNDEALKYQSRLRSENEEKEKSVKSLEIQLEAKFQSEKKEQKELDEIKKQLRDADLNKINKNDKNFTYYQNQQLQLQELINQEFKNQQSANKGSTEIKKAKDSGSKFSKILWDSVGVGVVILIAGAIYYLFIYEPPVDEELVALAEELEKRVKAHKDVLDPSTCTWQEYYAYKGWDPATGAPYEKTEEQKAAESKSKNTGESKTSESKSEKIEESKTDSKTVGSTEKAEENKTSESNQGKDEESKMNSKKVKSKGKKDEKRING